MAKRKVRGGMIGGSVGSFIGPVHRMAASMDGQAEFVAGTFSSTDYAKTKKTGRNDEKLAHVIRSDDGGGWTIQRRTPAPRGTAPALDIASDGTVLAAFAHPKRKATIVARFGPDGWERLGEPIPGIWSRPELTAADDGVVWFAGHWDQRLQLLGYVDGAWQRVDAPRMATVGRDGTLWGLDSGIVISPVLVRFDGEGWEQFDLPRTADGSTLSPRFPPVGAPDGSVWLGLERELGPDESEPWCGQGHTGQGLWRFDGGTWEHYFADACVDFVRVASDGAVYVSAADASDTYVLTPDAWAPAE